MTLTPKSLTSHTFNFHIAEISPWKKIRNVVSSHTSIIFVCSGGYVEGSGALVRGAGNLHSHPGGDVQSADAFQSRAVLMGICFAGNTAVGSRQLRKELREPSEIRSRVTVPTFLRILHEMLEPRPCPITLECLGMEVLAGLDPTGGTPDRQPPQWLRSVFDEIEANPLCEFALNDLAKRVAVDRAHLARSYRRFYAMTIGEHVRRARLSLAAELLSQQGLALDEIALRSGFFDAAHLKRHLLGATRWQASGLRQALISN